MAIWTHIFIRRIRARYHPIVLIIFRQICEPMMSQPSPSATHDAIMTTTARRTVGKT